MAEKQLEASKDEQIGFHKGALSTLAKEREEMMKILQIVEQLMQMHVKGLKELGVDLEEAAKEAKAAGTEEKKPIEDMLK
jgi:thiaminase|tara:strand:- start:936 stop:1175 length:240 start_codon:yes stop_codon:yes gene_type:complete